MARYNMPVAIRTDLKNTITAMRAIGLTEGDVVAEVAIILRGLYYSHDDDGDF